MNKCTNTITGYRARTKEVSNTLTYGSKYFGIPFVPEGERWPICDNCYREMILVLQLQISDLPEIPEGLSLNVDDMLQVFVCGYIEPHTTDPNWNEKTNKKSIKDNYKCFNNYESGKGGVQDHCVNLSSEATTEYRRLQNEYWGNDVFEEYASEDYGNHLSKSYSPLRFQTRFVNVKNKQPIQYQEPLWIEAYGLKVDDEGTLVDKLTRTKVNDGIKEFIFFWIDSRTYFAAGISQQALKITGWEKFSYECQKSLQAHEIFNGCFSHADGKEFTALPEEFVALDYLGALTINGYSVFDRGELGAYPNCECCDKPMQLIFSFHTRWCKEYGWADMDNLHGLFLCNEMGALKVICIDERR